jgi:hypothetical protein
MGMVSFGGSVFSLFFFSHTFLAIPQFPWAISLSKAQDITAIIFDTPISFRGETTQRFSLRYLS